MAAEEFQTALTTVTVLLQLQWHSDPVRHWTHTKQQHTNIFHESATVPRHWWWRMIYSVQMWMYNFAHSTRDCRVLPVSLRVRLVVCLSMRLYVLSRVWTHLHTFLPLHCFHQIRACTITTLQTHTHAQNADVVPPPHYQTKVFVMGKTKPRHDERLWGESMAALILINP